MKLGKSHILTCKSINHSNKSPFYYSNDLSKDNNYQIWVSYSLDLLSVLLLCAISITVTLMLTERYLYTTHTCTSLQERAVPLERKEANIVPLYKKRFKKQIRKLSATDVSISNLYAIRKINYGPHIGLSWQI